MGADCTDPGASLEQTGVDAVGIEGPLEVPEAYWDPAGEKGQDLGCPRLARRRWAAAAENRAAGDNAATACLDGERPAPGTPEVDAPCLWLTGVFQQRSCSPASRGPPPCALSIRQQCGSTATSWAVLVRIRAQVAAASRDGTDRSQKRGQEGQEGQVAADSLAAGRASSGGDSDCGLCSSFAGGTAAAAAAAAQHQEEAGAKKVAGLAAPVAAR